MIWPLSVCCLTRPPKLSGLKRKPTKTQTFVISRDYLGWPDSSSACFTGADSSFMFNRKGDCARRSRWFPSLSGLGSLLSWGCLGSCQHVPFTSIRLYWLPYLVVSGSILKLWSSVEARSLEAHAVAVTQCRRLHILLVKASYKSSPSPPPLPSAKIQRVRKQAPPLDGFAAENSVCQTLLFTLSIVPFHFTV